MKNARHTRILEIISQKTISTQDELQKELNNSGFKTTQATVSRDIRDLRLIKGHGPDGEIRYMVPKSQKSKGTMPAFQAIFNEAVIKIDFAMNTVVVKCHTGMANAVCAALDVMQLEEIVGTIAGDDTIFILTRNEEKAKALFNMLNDTLPTD